MTKIKVVTQGDKSVKVKPATVVQKRMAEIAIQGYAQAYADREHKRLKAERIRNWNMLGQVYNSCGSGGGYCYTSSGNRVDTGQYRSRLRDDRPGLQNTGSRGLSAEKPSMAAANRRNPGGDKASRDKENFQKWCRGNNIGGR